MTTLVAPTSSTNDTLSASKDLPPVATPLPPFSPESMAATAALFTSPHTSATFDTSILRDPLKINLKKQIQTLLSAIAPHPEVESTFSDALDILRLFVLGARRHDVGKVLEVLSRLLSVPLLVENVIKLFRPLLVDLFARWLDVGEDEDEGLQEERLVALAYVVEVHEEIFPIMYEYLTSVYPRGPLHLVETNPSTLSVERLHRLLLVYSRIQQVNRELPSLLSWSLSPLCKIIWSPEYNHDDNGIKLLAIRCYAYQSCMGEAERERFERKVLGMKEGEICSVDCWISPGGYGKKDEEGKEKALDGWVLPMLEVQRVRRMREGLCHEEVEEYFTFEEAEGKVYVEESDLSLRVASIHGILLLRQSSAAVRPSTLIPTPTSIMSLRALALLISMRNAILLTSAPSAGKALLLSHLAGLLFPETKNQIITIHLADTSLDPRSLLGSYISSPTHPGNFEWKDGVLVRAMREGRWVVFEDIDRGSQEVLGVIKPVVESLRLGNWIGAPAKLDVPSRGCVVAHQNFLVFATRSVQPSRNGKFAPPTFFGAHKFCETVIRAPQGEELKMIVERRFERLQGRAAEALIDLWEAVRGLGTAAGVRDVGLRELEKLCARVERILPTSHQAMDVEAPEGEVVPLWNVYTNPSLREEIYLEARDVLFGAGATTASAKAHLGAVAVIVGEKLGLDQERREWLLKGRTPRLDIEKDVNGNVTGVSVGTTRLAARQRKDFSDAPPSRPFAMHRPAVCLLSRIMTSTVLSEPILLTGETGTGKTSVITHLATLLGKSLTSLNLSHQTESSDLIGGLKPVDTRVPASTLYETFLELFGTTFSRKKNEKFELEVRKAMNEGRWKRVVGLWRESGRLAKERLNPKKVEGTGNEGSRDQDSSDAPRKRRKVDSTGSIASWDAFLKGVDEFEVQHVHGKGKFAFGFVEGPLVKAIRSGSWILLDEINLASPETLECVSGLLHGPTASITLTEQGSLEPVPRHPDFRLFACMNPATDVGKKDLPPNIRSRFTEIDVPPPDADKDTLLSIINQYIGACAVGDKGIVMNVAEFYMAVKDLAEKRQLADGANHRPHFSMRTLARAMTFAADMASMYSLRRSVWEGCLMAFTMVLDPPSAEIVTGLMHKHLLVGVGNSKSMLRARPSVPHGRSSEEFIKFGPFFLERGPYPEDAMEEYIMTPSVETKLIDLARIITTRRFPVLIEGPTSSGKTSSIEYLARRTGHQFVRINNHEHTDIQEYLGSYVSDPLTGKLVFKDGLLVHALRNGDWIVLDELNLAPTDVLEALNRLLDDNRELVIPETQEVVRPHPHFMLFATQNPPGLYAGRKVLSRAFRNRFLEVHFQDVPQTELESILCQRCKIAPSYGKRIVAVFRELQKRRQAGRVFESKQGFATLRDLFRWANRDAVGYQELADNGYMLLAERARREDDKFVVKEIVESIMGVRINEDALYSLYQPGVDVAEFLGSPLPSASNIIWTRAMQRLYILVSRALKFNEPVLLVGETGSGKTSVCQVFADATGQRLHALNCHRNTETADIIGALRPVRNRTALEAEVLQEASSTLAAVGVEPVGLSFESLAASLSRALKRSSSSVDHSRLAAAHRRLLGLQSIFEWRDGPLVEAMRSGEVFLLDEISLADDSVLERLNSVLEPGRTIVLAEKGGNNTSNPTVKAADTFKLVATMNPGGDYGKKELSPALRNRFTEIWVPRVDDRADLELIVDNLWRHADLKSFTQKVLDYTEWLGARVGDKSITSLRDIIAWVVFSNEVYTPQSTGYIAATEIFHHAAQMTYLDGLSSLPQLSTYSRGALALLKEEALKKLHEMVPLTENDTDGPVFDAAGYVQLGSFAIKKGLQEPQHQLFNLTAPTSRNNAMRILRGCQLSKPILLEGSPGVGKTSLVTALANISGHHLHRINLSDQTDLVDLFGSDFPVEGGSPGEFAWRDAEFLKALQQGHWVLLDEMNLAPQAVLEGLNAVLDHRGTVYIPELGRSFACHPSFRIFAAQNPLGQGGGRKGLPKSFVNRFTKVYIDELTSADLILVCQHMFPHVDENILRAMIAFNIHLNDEVTLQKLFGQLGTPWEFNLRDVIRWGYLLVSSERQQNPDAYLRSVYLQRFRTSDDRRRAQEMFDRIFATTSPHFQQVPFSFFSPSHLQIGHFSIPRCNYSSPSHPSRLIKSQLSAMETLGGCVSQGWLCIVTGPRDSGKSHLIRALADFTGNPLREISINSATDTMDIIGSFEQVDTRAQIIAVARDILCYTNAAFRNMERVGNIQNLLSVQDSLRLAISRIVTEDMVAPLLQQMSDLISGLSAQSLVVPQEILDRFRILSHSSSSTGRFEWVDGPIIQAMRQGEWLLLDGANLCNPSVLDRLNSLCEPNGQLTLNERGLVQDVVETIKPHTNFRLFMTVDPQYGELSRAMRNRGVEVFLPIGLLPDDYLTVVDHLRLPRFGTSVQHSTALSLQHQSVRRGLVQSHPLQADTVASSGHLLDQFSALSSVMDRFPLYLLPSNDIDLDASTFFLSRTFHHAYAPYFCRILDTWDGANGDLKQRLRGFVSSLSNLPLSSIISRMRDALVQVRGYPTEILSAHAADDLVEELSKSLNPSIANEILDTLDFSAAIFLQKKNSDTEGVLPPSTNQSTLKIRRGVEEFLAHLSDFNEFLFALLSSGPSVDLLSILSPILTVNRFGRDLDRILAQNPLNHSAIQVLACMINDIMKDIPTQVHPLGSSAGHLREVSLISSSAGLIEAWSKWCCKDVIMIDHDWNVQLDTFARSPNNVTGRPDVRLQALRLMSVLGAQSSQHNVHFTDITSLFQQQQKGHTTYHNPVAITPSFLVLNTLSSPPKRDVLEHTLNTVCRVPQESLLPYIPIQQMLWTLDLGADISAKYMQSISTWLETLFGVSENVETSINHLLQPSQLNNAIRLSDLNQFTLQAMGVYEQNVDLYLDTTLTDTTMSRQDLLGLLLRNILSLVVKCFHESHSQVPSVQTSDDLMAFLDILVLPDYGENPSLDSLRRHLEPLRSLPSHTAQQKLYRLGYGWASVGLTLLELLIPEIPIDPIAIKNTATALQKKEHDRVSTEIGLHHSLQRVTTGNEDSYILSVLRHRLQSVAYNATDEITVTGRDNIAQLHVYWGEVWQFRNQVIAENKILDLLGSFTTTNEAAVLRERVLQESITGFYQRLDTMYPRFRDLNMLLKLAMSQLRLGVRLISKMNTVNPSASAAMNALLRYPSICEVPESFPGDQGSVLTAFDSAHLDLLRSVIQASAEKKTRYLLPRLEQTYNQVLGLWLIDKAKEADSEAASRSLYRGSVLEHNAMTDGEFEELEFLSLFPSFENSLVEGKGAPDQTRPSKNVPDEAMVQIANLHLTLFSPPIPVCKGFGMINQTRKKLLSEIIDSYIHALPDSLDATALVYRLRFVRDARTDTRTVEHHTSYNFYKDPNLPELKSAVKVVLDLRAYLKGLIDEWPEQMVLQHLVDRCDIVLGFGLKSPVAKVLSALEQLLLHTDDWEMFANRDNTLSSHRQSLTELIVRWRRLELSCWNGLLQSEARTFMEGASEWWFKLYEANIRGLMDALSIGQEDEYLANLVPLIDDFLSSSPLGQLSFRIRLLQSFGQYISELFATKSSQEERCLRRILCIIQSTLQYHRLYEPALQLYLEEQRAALDKDIKKFIKLASWKDINVQALKQSAQKTHHQLYKIIRKFREVLREPITQRLKAIPPTVSNIKPLPEPVSLQTGDQAFHIPSDLALCPTGPLSDLNSTFRRFETIIHSKLVSAISRRRNDYADDLAISIITISKELSETPIPQNHSAEKRTKFLKSLLVRKRKAFSDLLKELKKAGLTGSVKAEVLRQNSNMLWLKGQPVLNSIIANFDVEKGETYFSRLIGCLPELRSSLSDHHKDLQTRELQRGLSFLDSGFSLAVDLRARLAVADDGYIRLKGICSRLSNLLASEVDVFQESLFDEIRVVARLMCRVSSAFAEIIYDLNVFKDVQGQDPKETPLDEVEGTLRDCNAFNDRLWQILEAIEPTPVPALRKDEHEIVSRSLDFFKSCVSLLERWSSTYPYLRYLFDPTREWLSSEEGTRIQLNPPHPEPLSCSPDALLNTLLFTVQVMIAETTKADGNTPQAEETEQQILNAHKEMRIFTHLLSLDRVLEQVNTLLSGILAEDSLKHVLQCVVPFLVAYQNLVENQLVVHAQWTQALFKLDFVLCSTLLRLSKEGFCQPPETEEGGDGEGESLEAADGTGLGEGSGTENVSKEIEDESQVEGLKGEDEGDQEQRKDDGDDNAVEMSEDFGGALEDVPDDGSQEEQDGSDEESEADPEERVEDIDPTDPSALDEKIWGDDSGPQDTKDDEDHTQKDRSEEQSSSSDVVAKENRRRSDKEKEKGKGEQDTKEQDEEVTETEERTEEEDEGEPNAAGAPMEDYVQDANTLDLPDDMELDAAEEDKEREKDTSEDGLEGEEELLDETMEDSGVEDETPFEDNQMDGIAQDAPQDVDDQDVGKGDQMEEKGHDEQPETDHPDEENAMEDLIARPDTSAGNGDDILNDQVRTQDQDIGSSGQAGSSAANQGQRSASQDQVIEQTGAHINAQESLLDNTPDDSKGNDMSGVQEGRHESSGEQKAPTNPLRSLGDALKEIRQRFDEILNSEAADQPKQNIGPPEAPGQLEYLQPDDEDEEMQALGPAGEEQVAKLNDLKFVEDDAQPDPSFTMDIDEPIQAEQHENVAESHAPQSEKNGSVRENVVGAILPGIVPLSQQSTLPDPSSVKADIDMKEEATDDSVEAELGQWKARDFPETQAEHMWRLYESMTHDLAYALCEQLRLILEPTLATRLKGDFRTGKRLNMKKIIPYIASDYTKDKIWLRRTRPSQREYQILIALDDSRSMAESHSIHLAYQTLALISKALSRLEAGDIAIAKFGGSVDILHGFDQGPFSDQAGTQVVNAFTFKQRSTNVLSLIDTSLRVLESARERRSMSSASAADLWQLEIIISDGICQDHDQLRTLLRKAEEQKVMIVFIILDSLRSNTTLASSSKDADAGSILTMTKAEFKNVNGKVEMQLQKYLDSFPFEYYVVLRSVDALPEVLAGTLKQFFERISEE